jgi:hypothetical protein
MEINIVHRPGMQFYAEPMTGFDGANSDGHPKRNNLYVICHDGSIQSQWDPVTPTEWYLMESDDQWFYCEMRADAKPKRCFVRYHGTSEDPPLGRGIIGEFYKGSIVIDEPQKAEISEQNDKGDDVASQLKKIATIDPLLAHCATIVGDPVQTAALANFAEGKMSYAEMRSLCG